MGWSGGPYKYFKMLQCHIFLNVYIGNLNPVTYFYHAFLYNGDLKTWLLSWVLSILETLMLQVYSWPHFIGRVIKMNKIYLKFHEINKPRKIVYLILKNEICAFLTYAQKIKEKNWVNCQKDWSLQILYWSGYLQLKHDSFLWFPSGVCNRVNVFKQIQSRYFSYYCFYLWDITAFPPSLSSFKIRGTSHCSLSISCPLFRIIIFT